MFYKNMLLQKTVGLKNNKSKKDKNNLLLQKAFEVDITSYENIKATVN